MSLCVFRRLQSTAIVLVLGVACLAGCGTTRMSNTNRTATEQLLISTAVDQAIDAMNFEVLADKDVYLDPQHLKEVTDSEYIISSLRQHLLAAGCVLKENREAAVYVIEARAGAVGTNHNEVMLGIRSISLPSMTPIAGSTTIPEIPFAKTTDQKGVAKIAVFAYNRHTGRSVWQSGTFQVVTSAKDTWLLGTGPFQRGSLYEGTRFAGSRILLPFVREPSKTYPERSPQPIAGEAIFREAPVAGSTNTPSQIGQTVSFDSPVPTTPSATLARVSKSSSDTSSANAPNTISTSSGNTAIPAPNAPSSGTVDGMSGFGNMPTGSVLRLPPLDRGSAK